MPNHTTGTILAAMVLTASAWADNTTVYHGNIDSVTQNSPPGSVANNQVLIINSDKQGNQQVLSIGNGTTVVRGPRPCSTDKPTQNMDCSGKDLRGVKWHGARLSASVFDGADLRDADLSGALLENTTFSDTKLDKADLSTAQIVNATFANASLSGAQLKGARLVNTQFMSSDLSNADLRNVSLINTGFMGSNLTEANLTGAQFVNTDFFSARLGDVTWVDGRRCASDSESECRR